MNCKRLWIGSAWACAAGVALLLLISGCAHSPYGASYMGAAEGIQAARPPAFLTGPMGVLLTNTQDFSAKAVFIQPPGQARPLSGELLCRGPKLLFAPETRDAPRKSFRRGGILFVWDVAEQHGYLLSDALQGYAPFTSEVRFTNVVQQAGLPSAGERIINGHRCEAQEEIVQSNGGRSTTLHIWRATDLKGLPLRLESASDSTQTILELSNVQFMPMKSSLFQPPAGFTPYDNPESMVNEFMAREFNTRPKRPQPVNPPNFQEHAPAQPYGLQY
jgi:hypothetical protein